MFQRQTPAPTAAQGKLGVLLLSDGDTALEQLSLNSLGAWDAGTHAGYRPHATYCQRSLKLGGCDRILPMVAGDRLAPLALAHLSALLDDGSAWAFADCDRDGPQGSAACRG